jgi:hypothetical protein
MWHTLYTSSSVPLFSRKKNIKLAGIVYLHRISDNRMSGAALNNLRTFANICGRDAMRGAIFVTTMWGDVKEEVGLRREVELKDIIRKDVMDIQCRMERFTNTSESAWRIIKMAMENSQSGSLLIQQEMGKGVSLRETTAFKEGLPKWLADLKEAFNNKIFQ